MTRASAVVLALVLLAGSGPSTSSQIAEQSPRASPRLDVPFEATPHAAVHAMLKLAKVDRGDFLIDLGSGDGRIPIAAAKTYGATALGVDLDPRRIRQARENARRHAVVGKVRFVQGDLFKADIRNATVISLFLQPDLNRRLRPRLLDLAPGTRIVSHAHDMGNWRPDRAITYPARAIPWEDRRLFLWVVPATIHGTWRLSVDGRELDVTIKQRYQRFSGSAMVDGKLRAIRNGRLTGDRVSFDLASGNGRVRRLSGRVTPAGEIHGKAWAAKREG